GAEDELTFVCKEIGNLIELHGYQFEEIGVVARTLEPYQAWLRQLFKLHRIPFTSSILMPMIHEPGIKSLLQLGSLGVNGFSSRDLLDVVRSPYYRMSRLTNRKEFIQPELWKECIQGLGITRGEEQWRRVSTLAESSAEEMSNRGLRETQDGRPNESKESIQLFDSLVQGLIADCHALPTSGRMAELADAFVALIGKHFILPGLSHEVGGDGPVSSCMTRLAEAIQSLLAQLAQLRCLQETLTWEEWMSLLVRLVKEESVPLEPGPHPGVRVLDAMEARGLPFRALFVLGLNEKVFPRFIREDAFLRDADRRVLAETFGYKIDEKLFGYDEERLIFALLRQAAKDRLYLSYQRADEAGRMLSPSSFLREINRSTTSSDNAQLFSLSRRFSDRLNDLLFRDSLLTVEELGLKLILKGMNPSIVLEHFDRESSLFKQGLISLKGIEQQTREIGSYDGLVGPIDDHWQNLLSRGISPTALEGYARCPYQYYASHLLHVRTVQNQLTDELPPSVIGTLCHAVLNRVYQQFIQDGWPVSPTSSDSFHALIVTEVEYVFAEHAREYSTGYGVIWQHLKDLVNTLVYAEVESSREECLRTKFHPLAVEADAEGYMELLDSRSWSSRFKVYGRLDRVDGNDETGEYRIVDYKFKMSAKTKSEERDLLTSGIRGLSLQPSLYSLMSEYRVRAPDGDIYHSFQPRSVEFVYLAPQRTTLVDRSVFERASWDAMAGQQLKKTMGNLLTGISNGDYFILPGNYCGHCSLSTACRRFHAPTMTRSYRSLQPKQLRHIRKQEIVGD
ncbi:MAG: PD-(D/E)XK nuclease family protein, partial [Nitrospirales bacterium]